MFARKGHLPLYSVCSNGILPQFENQRVVYSHLYVYSHSQFMQRQFDDWRVAIDETYYSLSKLLFASWQVPLTSLLARSSAIYLACRYYNSRRLSIVCGSISIIEYLPQVLLPLIFDLFTDSNEFIYKQLFASRSYYSCNELQRMHLCTARKLGRCNLFYCKRLIPVAPFIDCEGLVTSKCQSSCLGMIKKSPRFLLNYWVIFRLLTESYFRNQV